MSNNKDVPFNALNGMTAEQIRSGPFKEIEGYLDGLTPEQLQQLSDDRQQAILEAIEAEEARVRTFDELNGMSPDKIKALPIDELITRFVEVLTPEQLQKLTDDRQQIVLEMLDVEETRVKAETGKSDEEISAVIAPEPVPEHRVEEEKEPQPEKAADDGLKSLESLENEKERLTRMAHEPGLNDGKHEKELNNIIDRIVKVGKAIRDMSPASQEGAAIDKSVPAEPLAVEPEPEDEPVIVEEELVKHEVPEETPPAGSETEEEEHETDPLDLLFGEPEQKPLEAKAEAPTQAPAPAPVPASTLHMTYEKIDELSKKADEEAALGNTAGAKALYEQVDEQCTSNGMFRLAVKARINAGNASESEAYEWAREKFTEKRKFGDAADMEIAAKIAGADEGAREQVKAEATKEAHTWAAEQYDGMSGDNPVYISVAGTEYAKAGNKTTATARFLQAAEIRKNEGSFVNAADLFEQAEDYANAEDMCRKASEALEDKGEHERALRMSEKADKLHNKLESQQQEPAPAPAPADKEEKGATVRKTTGTPSMLRGHLPVGAPSVQPKKSALDELFDEPFGPEAEHEDDSLSALIIPLEEDAPADDPEFDETPPELESKPADESQDEPAPEPLQEQEPQEDVLDKAVSLAKGAQEQYKTLKSTDFVGIPQKLFKLSNLLSKRFADLVSSNGIGPMQEQAKDLLQSVKKLGNATALSEEAKEKLKFIRESLEGILSLEEGQEAEGKEAGPEKNPGAQLKERFDLRKGIGALRKVLQEQIEKHKYDQRHNIDEEEGVSVAPKGTKKGRQATSAKKTPKAAKKLKTSKAPKGQEVQGPIMEGEAMLLTEEQIDARLAEIRARIAKIDAELEQEENTP